MKKKIWIVLMGLFSLPIFLKAQGSLSFTPEQPKPGDVVHFKYEAPVNVFNESDTINCVAYKWGTYCDDATQADGRGYKPLDIVLKKNGHYYEGTVPTDSFTKMLALEFTSGNVKWKRASATTTILTSGKVDNNKNEGYCITFNTVDGKLCKYSHFFIGEYLSHNFNNGVGIKNPERAVEHLLKEQELFPEAKYYTLFWVYYNLQAQQEKLKTIVNKEIEKLFAGGLQSEKDLSLLIDLSGYIDLRKQADYFNKILQEKIKNSGSGQTLSSRFYDFYMEKDALKQEAIMNELTPLYFKEGFEERKNLSVPANMRRNILFNLAAEDKIDELKTGFEKYGYLKDGILETNTLWFLRGITDTMMAHGKIRGLVEKFALEHYTFYSDILTNAAKGIAFPHLTGDEHYTTKEKMNTITTAAVFAADLLAQCYIQKHDDKTAWKYAREARRYLQLTTADYADAPSVNTRYSLLAEKMLSAKQCKDEVEQLILSGEWKPDMLEVLKRIWVKQNKTETGFEDYVRSFRQGNVEEAKKTLLATQLNYVAPSFVLKDLEGKQVSLESLKGKTVVLDFWATWCRPCKASFPGMQKMVNYYKNNPDVQFLFVDTWENRNPKMDTDEKKLKAVTDYMNDKKYPFLVLMDNTNATVTDFKVEGIPCKFIIDKNGNVRYKVVGFESNEGKLFDEMTAMIESIK